jgi:hypothetical protein
MPEHQAEQVDHDTPTLLVTVGEGRCRRQHAWPSAVMILSSNHGCGMLARYNGVRRGKMPSLSQHRGRGRRRKGADR